MYKKLPKAILLAFLILSTMLITINSYSYEIQNETNNNTVNIIDGEADKINVCVLYSGDSSTWLDIYYSYSQPLLPYLEVEAFNIDENIPDFNKYDLVYPDKSILSSIKNDNLKNGILQYIEVGGSVFLENTFSSWLPNAVMGVSTYKEIKKLPENLEYPQVRDDLKNIQKLFKDYDKAYRGFARYKELKDQSYGLGIVPDTAIPIVKSGDTALLSMNHYKSGYVFYASKLLPNPWYISGFDMKPKSSEQKYFNNTVSAAGQMLRNEVAGFISKQKYGYSIQKVFGPNGRPAMSWQNHFEVGSAIGEKAIEKWVELTREYNEIPSYTLSRAMFEWHTRFESIAYQLNKANSTNFTFENNSGENIYADGKHAVVNQGWLMQAEYPKKQVLEKVPELPYRAYPSVYDLNSDGVLDIVSGSADGYIYYYEGLCKTPDWQLKQPIKLSGADGKSIKIEAFSAPVLYDVNGDKKPDLVCGTQSGEILWYQNQGGLVFKECGKLVTLPKGELNSAPDVDDFDRDGIADLVIGTNSGRVYFYKGTVKNKMLKFNSSYVLKDNKGNENLSNGYAAPRIVDIDNDQKNDLVVGTKDGYIRKYMITGKKLVFKGYLEDKYLNRNGNSNFLYGNYAVPDFADIDGDKHLDLIVGRLEYGMAVPIDSNWFKYKNQLTEAIDYCQNNFVSIGAHIYSNKYKNSLSEKAELLLHKKAFEVYGIDWGSIGANHHTWYTSNVYSQTIEREANSGLSWDFGFQPSQSEVAPSTGSEYTWIIPFYRCEGVNQTDMLIGNATFAREAMIDDTTGEWNTVASVFRHMEYAITKDPASMKKLALRLDTFRNKFDYNFMTEDKMVQSIKASLNIKLKIIGNLDTENYENTCLILNTSGDSQDAGLYKASTGVKIELGEKLKEFKLNTNSSIFMRKDNDLYLGLNKETRVWLEKYPENTFHIERANVPVEVDSKDGVIKIELLDGGLQQIKINAPRGLVLENITDWKVQQEDTKYVLTRYGQPTNITLISK